MSDVTIAYRPKDGDAHGTQILFGLRQLLEHGAIEGIGVKSVDWPPHQDGTVRYHLVGEGVDLDSLEPELDDINPNWRDHIERP